MYNLAFSRKTAMKITILIVLSFLLNQHLFSQPSVGKTDNLDVRNFKEEVFVRTDRDIYTTGEEVWFKVYKISGLTNSPSVLSKVVYVELLDKNNFPLKQLKVKTDYFSGFSSFTLPANLSSGNYVIRAYTNWMKNFSTDEFFYKTISVLNPFESIDHIKLPAQVNITDSVFSTAAYKSRSGLLDATGVPVKESNVTNENINQILYSVSFDKAAYSPREKVKISISASDKAGNPVETDLSVSIAKSAVVNSTAANSFFCFNLNQNTPVRVGGPEYLAELEGHLISGYLRLKATDEPLRNTDLSLSYVGKTARCQFGKTGENGEFNFVVKESGMNEIVIQPLSSDITGYYIELNQPFAGNFSNFKPAPFYLDSTRLEALNKVIIGMQIDNIYQPYRQSRQVESASPIPDFYGKPENSIKMADYIELTSLREIVKEIIPNVYTLKQNGKYDFKLINKYRGQPFENKPLILIDGVPVYDFEKVLSINSKEIEKADIINTRYFFSEYIFDGIVSFITKKGNLSAMEYDNSIFRQVYEGCQVPDLFYSPGYASAETKNNRIPDYRNTLYWNPALQTSKNGKSEFEFYTSDEYSDYVILVEGISADGKTGYISIPFSIKK
jgi:hypothetical protein